MFCLAMGPFCKERVQCQFKPFEKKKKHGVIHL
jgi:hypothetical protein